MIHETRNYREARAHFRSGQPGPGMIFRPLRNGLDGYVVFDRVEEARGHPSAQTDEVRVAHFAKADAR